MIEPLEGESQDILHLNRLNHVINLENIVTFPESFINKIAKKDERGLSELSLPSPRSPKFVRARDGIIPDSPTRVDASASAACITPSTTKGSGSFFKLQLPPLGSSNLPSPHSPTSVPPTSNSADAAATSYTESKQEDIRAKLTSILASARAMHTFYRRRVNKKTGGINARYRNSIVEWERRSRWPCCLNYTKHSAEVKKILDDDRDNIDRLTKKTLSVENFPVVGIPKLRVLHPKQVFWHTVRKHVFFFFMMAAACIFVPAFVMWLFMVFTEVDCNGLLVRLGIHNPNNFTGIYASCDDAPSDLFEFMLDQLWFSVQTVSTLGYGVLSPYDWWNTISSGLFGCAGFLMMEIYCGIAFARYSLIWETALVVHSCRAVITTFRGAAEIPPHTHTHTHTPRIKLHIHICVRHGHPTP